MTRVNYTVETDVPTWRARLLVVTDTRSVSLYLNTTDYIIGDAGNLESMDKRILYTWVDAERKRYLNIVLDTPNR